MKKTQYPRMGRNQFSDPKEGKTTKISLRMPVRVIRALKKHQKAKDLESMTAAVVDVLEQSPTLQEAVKA